MHLCRREKVIAILDYLYFDSNLFVPRPTDSEFIKEKSLKLKNSTFKFVQRLKALISIFAFKQHFNSFWLYSFSGNLQTIFKWCFWLLRYFFPLSGFPTSQILTLNVTTFTIGKFGCCVNPKLERNIFKFVLSESIGLHKFLEWTGKTLVGFMT